MGLRMPIQPMNHNWDPLIDSTQNSVHKRQKTSFCSRLHFFIWMLFKNKVQQTYQNAIVRKLSMFREFDYSSHYKVP